MIFVVDSNVLFTFFWKFMKFEQSKNFTKQEKNLEFFWKNSVFEGISSKEEIKLFSPEFALKEINKHSSEIMKKAGLTKDTFEKKKKELLEKVEFIALEEYSDFFKQAELLAKSYSEEEMRRSEASSTKDAKRPLESELLKDIDFFALALKLGCSIWTNDKLFKKQSEVSVLTTKEMIELLS